ncbi:MAG: hypothetical protein AAF680_12850 [Pseudomonadota bacterium]
MTTWVIFLASFVLGALACFLLGRGVNSTDANRLLRKRVALWLAQQARSPDPEITPAEKARIEQCMQGLPAARSRRFAAALTTYQSLLVEESKPDGAGKSNLRYSGEIQHQLECMLEELLL